MCSRCSSSSKASQSPQDLLTAPSNRDAPYEKPPASARRRALAVPCRNRCISTSWTHRKSARHVVLLACLLSLGIATMTRLRWPRLFFSSMLLGTGVVTARAPAGFPSSGNGLWYTSPGVDWVNSWLPIGNGRMAAMIPGGTNFEPIQLNIEGLWTGGPFQDPTYNGGNKQPSEQATMAQSMQDIRQAIFSSPNGTIGDVEVLATDQGAYGSYAGAGYLLSTIETSGPVSNYARWLDLDKGLARTIWTQDEILFNRTTFCSEDLGLYFCQQTTETTSHSTLPPISFAFSNYLQSDLPTPRITCVREDLIFLHNNVSDPGMEYGFLAVAWVEGEGNVTCIQSVDATSGLSNATLHISGDATEVSIGWFGGTNYNISAGTAASNFTFRGRSLIQYFPLEGVASLSSLTEDSPQSVINTHVKNYQKRVKSTFSLDLGQKPNLTHPTDVVRAAYRVDVGDPYLEWVLFNYGRYLLASSAMDSTLPVNLQGKWASGSSNPWSADYHANINLQMNYWMAEMSNLDVTQSLFDYMEKTWAPRGAYTAKILYNITRGWVVHNEMNIFGHTGMKLSGNSARWADYPESAVWMMLHVWDHFDYTNDISWWKKQGYPLLKGVASFHLDKLIWDLHSNDSTLVVAPCNSPEQVPITFGCSHAQQLIWQLFNAVEKGFEASGDTDTDFLEEVQVKKALMDPGIHIGSWSQLQEWKVDMDDPLDTHRHLSHLVGLYPGYAVAAYDPSIQKRAKANYTTQQVIDAATVSLIHRGDGIGPDADSGWEKVWRAACWAQLANKTQFYHELTFALSENFAPNLFSLYSPGSGVFQIDANLGYPAAVLNALVQAPDVPSLSTPLTVTLLPALPDAWSTGSIQGARIRGAMTLDMRWRDAVLTSASFIVDPSAKSRPVIVMSGGKVRARFTSTPGMIRSV